MPSNRTHIKLADLISRSMCIGCGLCEGIAEPNTIAMTKSRKTGFLHPHVIGEPSESTLQKIMSCCPSLHLETLPTDEITDNTLHDAVWGPYFRIVHGWATDTEVRFESSSGGALSALACQLLASKEVDFILHATVSSKDPTFGAATLSFSQKDVLGVNGSRYGPTDVLSQIGEVLDRGRPFAIIAKPCDISALRNCARYDKRVNVLVKYWIALVCGGFMPPKGTDDFLADHGLNREELHSFRYRGQGCPGPTKVESRGGHKVRTTYQDFWGKDYGRYTLPHRCKICPDSIGEGADLVAGDTWEGGAPDQETQDQDLGHNVIIARTQRGVRLMEEAERDGFLTLTTDASIEQMNNYQPHQVARKKAVWPRLMGMRDEGRIVPQIHGLRIEELASEMGKNFFELQYQGTRRRIQEGKADEPETK